MDPAGPFSGSLWNFEGSLDPWDPKDWPRFYQDSSEFRMWHIPDLSEGSSKDFQGSFLGIFALVLLTMDAAVVLCCCVGCHGNAPRIVCSFLNCRSFVSFVIG